MNIEIERKFLVDKHNWEQLIKPVPLLIKQGYLLTEQDKNIRVRIAGEFAYLTIKAKSVGFARKEFEYNIPIEDSKDLMKLCDAVISKRRYSIIFDGRLWTVDEFLDANEGLIMAEIELNDENEPFGKPGWITKEVTDDKKYYNSNLSVRPYGKW